MPRVPSCQPWLKQHQHVAPLRQLLDLVEAGYEFWRGGAGPPAIAGGRPARIVPFPSPRPFARRDRRAASRALRAQNGSFFDGGAVPRFERALERRFGARHAVAVSSGTAALHAALIAARVGPGDEVCVPAITYVSTALAVLYQGARVRFVDVHPDTWTLDPARLAAAVGARTRAVMPVHLGGVPCDLGAIRAVAARHGLAVVEDAAQAHGATFESRAVGACGDLGCLSFGTTKTVCTGEGGAVLTDDDELARRARLAMNVGESTPEGRATLGLERFEPATALHYELLGWNYRMSAVQAALGTGQVERLDALVTRRRENAERLWARLAPLGAFRPQALPAGASPSPWNLLLELADDAGLPERDALLRGLARERIDFVVPYRQSLAEHPIFGASPERYPVAERFCRRVLGLRVDPALGPRELDATTFALRRLVEWHRG